LAKARIDLCLHSADLQAMSYQAINPYWDEQWISDHRAVVVELEPR
jgi:endonuclease/exonuclease/phosphatase family metal-dependent hydrolase